MGLLLTCITSRADLIGEAIVDEADALGLSTIDYADGWGIGFYHAGEVLHRKRPQRIEGALPWSEIVADIRSHVAIAHVRQATMGERRAENTHPFRMRQWLCAHAGKLEGFDAFQGQLVEALPDFLRRNIRGVTDSEHLFHVVLSFLHDSGQLDAVDANESAVVGALRSTVTLVDTYAREVGAPPGQLALALTNGRQLYAICRGAPMVLCERDRLPERPSEDPGGPRAAASLRYVVVATPPPGEAPTGYEELETGTIVAVDRDLNLSRHPL